MESLARSYGDSLYNFKRCPLTLKTNLVCIFWISTAPSRWTGMTWYGPFQCDLSFPGNSFNLELKGKTFWPRWNSFRNVSIIKFLGLILVNLCILVSIIPYFFQFIQLQLPLLSCCLVVKIKVLNSPICLVLKFHRQMASFPIHQTKRRHHNWCLISCSICPQSISKL